MTTTIMATNFFLNILANIDISGIAIPASPITNAMTAPKLISLPINATPIGMAVSARI